MAQTYFIPQFKGQFWKHPVSRRHLQTFTRHFCEQWVNRVIDLVLVDIVMMYKIVFLWNEDVPNSSTCASSDGADLFYTIFYKIPTSFCLFPSFFPHSNFNDKSRLNLNFINWKKCAWYLNPGQHDGRRWRFHWAFFNLKTRKTYISKNLPPASCNGQNLQHWRYWNILNPWLKDSLAGGAERYVAV